MNVLQINCQSLRTSKALIAQALSKYDVDVLVAQEVWKPPNPFFFNYLNPFLKLRSDESRAGGVGIWIRKEAKAVRLKKLEVEGLEAVWAEVKVGRIRCLVGSVYVNVNQVQQIKKLGEVLLQVKDQFSSIIIGMDANARHMLWEHQLEQMTVNRSTRTFKMGEMLKDIVLENGMVILNSGECTYRSGNVSSAPDVTVVKGFEDLPLKWRVLEEDLLSPHSPILVEIGKKEEFKAYETIDWEAFNWELYAIKSKSVLVELLQRWKSSKVAPVQAVEQLADVINELVNDLAAVKIISKHTKPWISKEIAEEIKKLNVAKKRLRNHRSKRNHDILVNLRVSVSVKLQIAKEAWIQEECEKLPEMPEKQKWSIINKLSNASQPAMSVQPIEQVHPDGSSEFVFEEEGIRDMMEGYHIAKDLSEQEVRTRQAIIKSMVGRVKKDIKDQKGELDPIMVAPISEEEVDKTFGSNKGAPGPDWIPASLIDGADREAMRACMLYVYEALWGEGVFPAQWKREIRALIPKPVKDSYHHCNAYRTFSLTAILGKRFEFITGRRVKSHLESLGFDPDQFAYLEGRSATQACTYLVERLARGVAEGKAVGGIFFDLVDAFGSVNRATLLKKIYLDFGIRGNLFLHLADFLSNRKASLKIGRNQGEWKDSHSGTSAGTVLGPILFIIYGHDAPAAIKPKFADDFSGISVEDSPAQLQISLQSHADSMAAWAIKNDVLINHAKTVFIQFGQIHPNITVHFKGKQVKQVEEHRCLGVWVDSRLSFRKHVEVATTKASRSLSKFFPLIKARRGATVRIGITCYVALMRCHMEYSAAAWWFKGHQQISAFSKVQYQALRSMTGAFDKSAANALEVITNIQPFQARIRELLLREWSRFISLPRDNPLAILLQEVGEGQSIASPMAYLVKTAKKFQNMLIDRDLFIAPRSPLLPDHILQQRNLQLIQVITSDVGKANSRSEQQKMNAKQDVEAFLVDHLNDSTIVAFTDGSVSVKAKGGCACVLVGSKSMEVSSRPVPGSDNVTAEVEGVVLAIESAAVHVKSETTRKVNKVIILSDCEAGIAITSNQKDVGSWLSQFERLWKADNILKDLDVVVSMGWIPSHCGIIYNEMADQEAKEAANSNVERDLAPLSIPQAASLAKDFIPRRRRTSLRKSGRLLGTDQCLE